MAEGQGADALERATPEQRTYVQLAARLAGQMAVTDVKPGDLDHAILLIEQTASIDFDIPTISSTPPLRASKVVVKRLVGFSVRFIANQVTLLGNSLVTFGHAVTLRIEQLDEQTAATQATMVDLERRVAALEDTASKAERT